MFKELSHRPEVEVLFTKYASSSDFMTAADLRMFLMGEQSACPTVEECQKLVECYEPTDEGKASGRMSLDGEQTWPCGVDAVFPAEMATGSNSTVHAFTVVLNMQCPLCSRCGVGLATVCNEHVGLIQGHIHTYICTYVIYLYFYPCF